MDTQQIAALANEIAAAHSFEYAGNFGRGTLRFQVQVIVSEAAVTLSAVTNAQISEKRAKEELAKVWGELVARLGDEASAYKKQTSGGYKVWRQGFWHMGRFCTSAFARGLEVRAEVSA